MLFNLGSFLVIVDARNVIQMIVCLSYKRNRTTNRIH